MKAKKVLKCLSCGQELKLGMAFWVTEDNIFCSSECLAYWYGESDTIDKINKKGLLNDYGVYSRAKK